jgi:hypothetical protein
MNNTAQLPNKPSGLIRLALEDLKKCLANPDYEIDMDVWHSPTDEGTCHVCLAGAVMAQTLRLEPDGDLSPYDLVTKYHMPQEVVDKLRAINSLRLGMVEFGLDAMGIDIAESGLALDKYYTITAYADDVEQFQQDLHELANTLERQGV